MRRDHEPLQGVRMIQAADPVPADRPAEQIRVLIVADHCSMRYGGEASLPIHWFLGLLREGVDVRFLLHGRGKSEIDELLGEHADRIYYVPDILLQRILCKLGKPLPHIVKNFTTEWIAHLITQFMQRRVMRRLIEQFEINLVHEPIPVTPRLPSMTYGLGVPVVIGPMNGGMTYPPGFRSPFFLEQVFVPLARGFTDLANWLIPGKRHAALLMVANERTRRALPRNRGAHVELLCENGVDPEVWRRPDDLPARSGDALRLVFSGRLVEWKRVDIVLDVFAEVRRQAPGAELWIIGDGREGSRLRRQAEALGLSDAVTFHGWVDQQQCSRLLSQCDVFLYPSMLDCGGAVVLEAMALGLPIVALNWGGPGDYLASGCGVAVDPAPRPRLIDELVKAVLDLTPEKRRELGEAARREIADHYTWPVKVRKVIEKYTAIQSAGMLDPKVEGAARES